MSFATEREAAYDPNNSVLVHGDAHSHNALRSFDKKGGYKFVDPDGLFAIWQWGFIERVSTGLLMLQIGMTQSGVRTLAVAELWADAAISWNR